MEPVSMAATIEDFEEGGLYVPPYHRYAFFTIHALQIRNKIGKKRQRILVAGCGWGYLVEDLMQMGYDAWGCDISPYATQRADEVLRPEAAHHIVRADVTDRQSLEWLTGLMGLQANERIDCIVTEDLFTFMNDAAIHRALVELRHIGHRLIHYISSSDLRTEFDPRVNWKTARAWRDVIGPDDVFFECDSGAEILR